MCMWSVVSGMRVSTERASCPWGLRCLHVVVLTIQPFPPRLISRVLSTEGRQCWSRLSSHGVLA